MFKLLITVAAGLLVVGCGQHPVDESLAIQEDFANEVCDCPDIVAGGYMGSRSACLADNGNTLTEAEIECNRAVYDRNESVASAPASCFIDTSKEMLDCVKSASCNTAALETCLDMFSLDSCPAFPESVNAEFNACSGP